jgi:hypothetical protein
MSLYTDATIYRRPPRPPRPVSAGLHSLTARIAADRQTRADAFELRYTSFLAGGFIDPSSSGMFSDSYDDKPNCQSIVIYKEDRPVASVRLCVLDSNPTRLGWADIPACKTFADEITSLLDGVRALGLGKPPMAVEIGRLVRHPDFASDFELVFVLFRLVSFMVLKLQADMMLSCVRANHVQFYRRLNFQKIAGPRLYPGVKFETNLVVCQARNYEANLQNFPIVDSGALENGCYDGLFAGDTVPVFTNDLISNRKGH